MLNNQYKMAWLGAISIGLSSLLVSGCIRKLDVNLPQGTAQLVVNTHLTDDDIVPADTTYNNNVLSNLPNVQLSITADPLDPQVRAIGEAPGFLLRRTGDEPLGLFAPPRREVARFGHPPGITGQIEQTLERRRIECGART